MLYKERNFNYASGRLTCVRAGSNVRYGHSRQHKYKNKKQITFFNDKNFKDEKSDVPSSNYFTRLAWHFNYGYWEAGIYSQKSDSIRKFNDRELYRKYLNLTVTSAIVIESEHCALFNTAYIYTNLDSLTIRE